MHTHTHIYARANTHTYTHAKVLCTMHDVLKLETAAAKSRVRFET